MQCPKCGNTNLQIITETKQKEKIFQQRKAAVALFCLDG